MNEIRDIKGLVLGNIGASSVVLIVISALKTTLNKSTRISISDQVLQIKRDVK